MSEDLKKKLREEIEVCSWSLLDQHYQRGAVFHISQELDLVEVAVAVALDNVDTVKTWKEAGDFQTPDDYDVNKWQENPDDKVFKFLIVQPFVLIQKIVTQ